MSWFLFNCTKNRLKMFEFMKTTTSKKESNKKYYWEYNIMAI